MVPWSCGMKVIIVSWLYTIEASGPALLPMAILALALHLFTDYAILFT